MGLNSTGTAADRGASRSIGRPRHARARIISRVREFLDTQPPDLLSVSDMARIAGVSERSLRQVVRDYYGESLSPKSEFLHHPRDDIAVELYLAVCYSELAIHSPNLPTEFAFGHAICVSMKDKDDILGSEFQSGRIHG
jgi:AraC-like DNA-binding protein